MKKLFYLLLFLFPLLFSSCERCEYCEKSVVLMKVCGEKDIADMEADGWDCGN
jgi:hypothetical protein